MIVPTYTYIPIVCLALVDTAKELFKLVVIINNPNSNV